MTPILEVTGLVVEDGGRRSLDAGHLMLRGGTVGVVCGPTDSGKTLLAAVLCGRAAAAGTVSVDGRVLSGSPAVRRRKGLAATLSNGGRVAGCSVAEALRLAGPRRATAALARFPLLAHRAGVRAELLSGGEQAVLQVACAWSGEPRVLVLDSPTAGLADDTAELVRQVARDTAAAGGCVLWLDQDDAGAPVLAGWQLSAGVLSPARAAASPTPLA